MTVKPPDSPSLADRTAHGFAFMLAQGLASKLCSLLGQFVLARWLLDDRDFGIYALASAVFAFTCLPQLAGTSELLIHRQARFRRWAGAAWWLSLALGLAGALLTAGAAPLMAVVFDEPDLRRVLFILALAVVPTGLLAVPNARLACELRFAHAALVATAAVLLTTVLSIALAWLARGTPWSGAPALAIARVSAVTLQFALLLLIAAPPLRLRLDLRRWPSLLADNGWLLLGKVFLLGVSQGDTIILGLLVSERAVGLYYFALSLSMQTMALITSNLGAVIFPALAKLQQSAAQQASAFLRATRTLALIAVPACFLQAALAEPVIKLLFRGKWDNAIVLLQVLSIGMAMRAVGSPAGSLMLAQGRFRALSLINALYSGVFITFTAAGALAAQERGVALAAALFFSLLGPVHVAVAVHPARLGLAPVLNVFARPLLLATASVGPAWALGLALPLPESDAGHATRAMLTTAAAAPLAVLLARRLMPLELAELASRLAGLPGGRLPASLLTTRRPHHDAAED